MKGVLADLDNIAQNNRDRNNEFESFLKQLIEKVQEASDGKGQQARTLNPLKDDRMKFHRELMNQEPITNPSEVFQTAELREALDSIDKQF